MHNNKDLETIIVVNEGVLIVPILKQEEKIGNMSLPIAKMNEHSDVLMGWVVKHGPGYHIPKDEYEEWKSEPKKSHYVPIDIMENDKVYYHRGGKTVITIGSTEYHLVKYDSILLIDRVE